MTSEEREFLEQWEKAKKTGFWLFCLKIGGVWAVVIFSTIQLFTCFDSSAPPFEFSKELFLSFLNYFLAGYFGVGSLIWFYSEYRYKKIKKKNDVV